MRGTAPAGAFELAASPPIFGGGRERNALLLNFAHDRTCKRVLTRSLYAGRELEHRPLVDFADGLDSHEMRLTFGQSARLVDDERVHPFERF